MDFNYSPEDEAFRKEVQAWLRENLPKGWGTPAYPIPENDEERFQLGLEWQKKLHQKGWVALTWPKEYGGGGGTLMQQVILDEEMAKVRAPRPANAIALGMLGPTILAAGTEEQKRRFVPMMISGEEIWCQGFSEPDAGSDLASLNTRAVVDGDYYVVNGQKVWSSIAHHADWNGMLVRTDPNAPKHRGITFLLVDMHSPGIEVRPLRQITGDAEFNEVFFDNVRVPRSSAVGQENRGWYVAMTTLAFERTSTGQAIHFKQQLADLTSLATRAMRNGRPAIQDPAIRQKLAQSAIECQIFLLNSYRTLSSLLKGGVPGPEAQMGKVFWSEMNQRITELATQIIGSDVLLNQGDRELKRWQYGFLRAKGNTIEQGTSEVVRTVVGERALGLPR